MKNWIIALAVLIIPMVTYYILDTTHSNKAGFEANAQNTYSKPVVIKFASAMCLDCKKMENVMNDIMPKYSDKITYEKINAQSNDSNTNTLIKKYAVTLVPTVIFLKKDGSVYKRTEGFIPKNELEKILEGLING